MSEEYAVFYFDIFTLFNFYIVGYYFSIFLLYLFYYLQLSSFFIAERKNIKLYKIKIIEQFIKQKEITEINQIFKYSEL